MEATNHITTNHFTIYSPTVHLIRIQEPDILNK
jgi:hypothetical protein